MPSGSGLSQPERDILHRQLIIAQKQIRKYSANKTYDSSRLEHARLFLTGIEKAIDKNKHNTHSRAAIQLEIDSLATASETKKKRAHLSALSAIVRGPRDYQTRCAKNRRLNQRRP